MGVIFVFSVCIHVCIFGGDEIECYLSIQGMYGYIWCTIFSHTFMSLAMQFLNKFFNLLGSEPLVSQLEKKKKKKKGGGGERNICPSQKDLLTIFTWIYDQSRVYIMILSL